MRDYWGYQEKVCVVTGASSGMGKAAAEMLLELGARVYGLSRTPPKDFAGTYIQTDLGSRESIDRAFAQLPDRIDNFFGIAGLTGMHTDYTTTFLVNYTANPYMVRKYLLDRMGEGGSIGFISSAAGLRWENPEVQKSYLDFVNADWDETVRLIEEKGLKDELGKLAYPVAKRAMNYFTAQLADELAGRKIRVNVVLPGSTDTGMTDDFVQNLGSMERLVQFTGGGRLANAQEMAAPIVFLGSEMASYISGVDMVVDYALNAGMLIGRKPDFYAPRKPK